MRDDKKHTTNEQMLYEKIEQQRDIIRILEDKLKQSDTDLTIAHYKARIEQLEMVIVKMATAILLGV